MLNGVGRVPDTALSGGVVPPSNIGGEQVRDRLMLKTWVHALVLSGGVDQRNRHVRQRYTPAGSGAILGSEDASCIVGGAGPGGSAEEVQMCGEARSLV